MFGKKKFDPYEIKCPVCEEDEGFSFSGWTKLSNEATYSCNKCRSTYTIAQLKDFFN